MQNEANPLCARHTAVLLVNYGACQVTLDCLEKLAELRESPLAIIVLDNGSGKEVREQLLAGWRAIWQRHHRAAPVVAGENEIPPAPGDWLVALPDNRGFAGANNAGVRLALQLAHCQAIWLLNNDTLPAADSLDALCAALNDDHHSALAGSTVLYACKPDRIQCAGGGRLNRWLGTTSLLGDGSRLGEATHFPKPDFLLGASLLARREVFEKCGLLSPEYFLYYEEVDFCLAAQAAGFGLAWAPQSIVHHLEGASTGASGSGGRHVRRPAHIDYLSIRNRVYLMKKWFPWRLPLALAGLGVTLIRRLLRGQGTRIPLLLSAARAALAGQMGRPPAKIMEKPCHASRS